MMIQCEWVSSSVVPRMPRHDGIEILLGRDLALRLRRVERLRQAWLRSPIVGITFRRSASSMRWAGLAMFDGSEAVVITGALGAEIVPPLHSAIMRIRNRPEDIRYEHG